ncbi:ABC transporter substrate-binding protein [Pseudomonas sp. 8O]|uniref:ABC transporter substrate-binding protein n=1 Tax=Pseudomonas sp. 8O TaxID=2653165 RepID=UPI0012F11498|nr:ABC transporter substrate-binding protein [Pseudomonas sp. 8O]VXC34217.1 Amino acid/amide ABC transporter substrate-binding protein, HAAT family (TC 3.A.1.4.-) [Pseudomonas sp. 8O]
MHRISCRLLFCLAAVFGVAAGASANDLQVRIGYLAHLPPRGPLLSNVIPEPADAGRRGAELAIIDSNSTGRFLKQQFELQSAESAETSDVLAAAERLHQAGIRLFVVNAPAATLRQLSERLPDSLLLNAGSADDGLRREQCLGNVLHTLPSRAMLADALAQFLAVRKWTRWLLVTGTTADDIAYADALKHAAKRFGHKIVAEKSWSFDNDQRRSAQAEMPLFTQASEYDVVLVADERGDFGEYLPYNTWYPRPVAGTQGLTPTAWHKTVETFGATQLQKRFEALAGRWMNDRDFAAWMAVRSIATGVTKLRAAEPQGIRHLLLNEQLPLDGFKGRKLSFRPWNGELRQPIALVHPRALVSTSPQDGFLHPHNEMDSLGYDRPEVSCDLASTTH